MKTKLHTLLKRQLKESVLENIQPGDGLSDFIKVINQTYHQFDLNRLTMERSLELSAIEQHKTNSQLQIMAGGITHDFNNILTGILGNIALARLYAQKGRDISEKLKAAEQASLRAQELALQFLTFVRAGEPPSKTSESPINNQQAIPNRGTIVIMDDDKAVLEVTEQHLTYLGYYVIAIGNSFELTELFTLARDAGIHFDLVILDLTISGDSGGEIALKKVREIDPHIRAIVASGFSNNPVMVGYQTHGFDGKVCKPFRISELGSEVKRVMGQ